MDRQTKLRGLRRQRRMRRVRRNMTGTPERPRLSVHRSNKAIYVQAIDDLNGVTLAAYSSRALDSATLEGKKKVEVAREVGKHVAERLASRGVGRVVFDRGWYRFHGRVKAVAEGAREGGLDF